MRIEQKIVYKVFEEILTTRELGTYKAYGIECCEAESGKMIIAISDVSVNESFVSMLAKKCTDGELSPIHLYDVVEDSI